MWLGLLLLASRLLKERRLAPRHEVLPRSSRSRVPTRTTLLGVPPLRSPFLVLPPSTCLSLCRPCLDRWRLHLSPHGRRRVQPSSLYHGSLHLLLVLLRLFQLPLLQVHLGWVLPFPPREGPARERCTTISRRWLISRFQFCFLRKALICRDQRPEWFGVQG
ncbi:hypothetical protein F4780DRAFT_729676 [Xylariomycetidae sp. FL0641]|nr:hypothetical protein F4780DRAFT_729676 [Xylariomycetidae sp. FL0641]